jgi:hypothetical protein
MSNYPTILGTEPVETGIVPCSRWDATHHLVSEALIRQAAISLGDERLYRFPLVARTERLGKVTRKLPGDWYRWMLYKLPYESSLDEIESHLRRLNAVRDSRDEVPFPFLAGDIASNQINFPYMGGQNITITPVFVRAFRPFEM